jgi:hypothetical protein
LRELIRLHIAPENYENETIKQAMGFRVRNPANERVMEQAGEGLRVGARFTIGLGCVCVAFFLLLALWSWFDGAGAVSLFFLAFVTLAGYLILVSGSTEMNKDHITYVTPIGIYRIKWDEVTEVEMDAFYGSAMVFTGQNKVLSLLGPSYWSGKDKERMLKFFSAQIGNRDIAVKETPRLWVLNKNTKVKSKNQ